MTREEMTDLSKTGALTGEETAERLKAARVAVFGLGSVGGYAAEALVRSGIGAIDLIDGSMIEAKDLNRHIAALKNTVGRLKADVLSERFLTVNPELKLKAYRLHFSEFSAEEYDFAEYDYVVDAMGGVGVKALLARTCSDFGRRLISSIGAADRLDPMGFRISDIFSPGVCPEARIMRHELRSCGIDRLKIVFSKELPAGENENPAKAVFACASAGMIIASEVVGDLISIK